MKRIGKNGNPFNIWEFATKFKDSLNMKNKGEWTKEQIVNLFFTMIPDFGHKETGKYLDGKM